MRDGKCFTMVYSEQLIKKTKCSITLFFVVFLYFSLNIKADGGASSVWLQTVSHSDLFGVYDRLPPSPAQFI